MHLNSALVFKEHAASYIRDGAHVLEIGPDQRPSTYQTLVGAETSAWVTADIDPSSGLYLQAGADVAMPSPYDMPFDDMTFDIVLSGQVLEHISEPWRWMAEAARVTKVGGAVITIAPVSWPYHAAPIDCFRYFPAGMDSLCRYGGLVPVVSWHGSLERPQSSRTYPGVSVQGDGVPRVGFLKSLIFRAVGWPRPVAIDLVSVAVKPG